MVERTREWSTDSTATFPAHPFRFRPHSNPLQEQLAMLALRPLRQKALTFVLETADPLPQKVNRRSAPVMPSDNPYLLSPSLSVRPLNKHQEVNCGKVASLSKFVLSPRVRRCFSVRDLDEVGSSTILPLRQYGTSASFGAPPLT